MNCTLESSVFLRGLRTLKEAYLIIEEKIRSVYLESFIYRLIKKMNETTKICFRYSLLGRITELKEAPPMVLDNSRTVQSLINFYKRWRDKTIYYLRFSFTLSLAKDTKEELIFSPVRIGSVIVVTAILVNVALSIVLHKQIGLWGWLMRGLFLFTGVSGLFCQADWPTIKKSSIFLRKAKIN